MRNRILEIVVFLMDFLQQGAKENFHPDELSDTLEQMGYSDSEISSAYKWMLERLHGNPEKYFDKYPEKPKSLRLLSSVERQQISPAAFGYVLKLKDLDLITDLDMELILEKASQIGTYPMSENQMKVLVSSVVFPELAGADIEEISSDSASYRKNFH